MYSHNPSDMTSWQNAKTFQDLCEVTALWLQGKNDYRPGYFCDIDPETEPLVPILSMYNRAGLLTQGSQPGVPIDDTGSGQRAWLEGLVQEKLARRILALGLYTDLLIFGYKPGEVGGYMIPITIVNFHPFTWAGSSSGYQEYDEYIEICKGETIVELIMTWKLCIIDPKWGRKKYLWEKITKVLITPPEKLAPYDIEPSPDLEVDCDFYH